MDVALDRRVAAAFARVIDIDEQDDILDDARSSDTWDDLSPEIQQLIVEVEARPFREGVPEALKPMLLAAAGDAGVTASVSTPTCTSEFCLYPLHPGPCKKNLVDVKPAGRRGRGDTGEPALPGTSARKPTTITGHSGPSWKTNFSHALTQDTGPEGVRVMDFDVHHPGSPPYRVAHGTLWRLGGTSFLIEHEETPTGKRKAEAQLAMTQRFHDRWIRDRDGSQHTQGYFLAQRERPLSDEQKAKIAEYADPGDRVFATAGEGIVSVWETGTYDLPAQDQFEEYMLHEHGHNVARVRDGERLDYSPEWLDAVTSDSTGGGPMSRVTDFTMTGATAMGRQVNGTGHIADRPLPGGVTQYGTSNPAEDFAEALLMYRLGPLGNGRIRGQRGQQRVYFRDLFPARAAVFDQEFPDFAAAQLASIRQTRGGGR